MWEMWEMSSGLKSNENQHFALSGKNAARDSHFESPVVSRKPASETTEIPDATPPLRFNTTTLDELSEELDRRTKETQRLQEMVENATKAALERFGCTYILSKSPEPNCQNRKLYVSPKQAVTEPWVCGQNNVNQAVVSYPKKNLKNEMGTCLLSDVQINKTHEQLEQETFSFDKAIVNLQTKLQKVQMEKDAQSHLRLNDSKKHVDQMERMLYMLEDLQNIKRTTDQKLHETEVEAMALKGKVETLEQVTKEMYTSLVLHEKGNGNGNDNITSPNFSHGSSRASKLTDDFDNEVDQPQDKVFLTVEQLDSEECSELKKNNLRIEDLIAGLGQEMALLTDMLSSSNQSSVSLSAKLKLLKRLAEKQTSLQQSQVRKLEATLSSERDKICCLEQQMIQAHSQLVDAHTKREESLQQAEELKRCSEHQQSELQVVVDSLRGELEVSREQNRRGEEEKICLQALLERRVQEEREILLYEKNQELELRQQENQQHISRLEEAQSRCQTLYAEGEMLRLTLGDREKIINILKLQTEGSTHTIENLHQENSLLSNQLNLHKLEIQHLRAELDQHKSDLAAAEHEKQQLQASIAEQSQRVQEETLEKQQLITQLEVQRMQLLTLTKEHKELQRLNSCKTEEQEGVVLELRSQLRNTHDELDQVRSTLRTLEGTDGHGLQVAMDMQKEITAGREQVDTLQGKILHLEEALDKMYQKKRYQNLENQRQLQELTFIREERTHFAKELEALRSKDQQLRDRIGELEAILHKMSESFTGCQDFIQMQEQEFFRLKLKHALDLKELQGKHLNNSLSKPSTDHTSVTPSPVHARPPSQHVNTQTKSRRQQKNHTQEHRSVASELRVMISENHRPHSNNGTVDSSFHRRRSAPERVQSTALSTDNIKEVKAESRLRRKPFGSEPALMRTAKLNGAITNNKSFTETSAVKYTYSPQLLSLGRRSPVHCLLTSDPNS